MPRVRWHHPPDRACASIPFASSVQRSGRCRPGGWQPAGRRWMYMIMSDNMSGQLLHRGCATRYWLLATCGTGTIIPPQIDGISFALAVWYQAGKARTARAIAIAVQRRGTYQGRGRLWLVIVIRCRGSGLDRDVLLSSPTHRFGFMSAWNAHHSAEAHAS
jgi:hypothetical protein